MDANFKPVRIERTELLERFPCGKHVYYHCGCLGRKQTKPNIESNLPVIDKAIEHRNRKEKWSCKTVYKDQILDLGISSSKSDAKAASKDVEIVITKIEN